MLWWDYGVENDHFRGSALHAMLGFGRPQKTLDEHHPAWCAALTASKVTTWEVAPCMLCCDYSIRNDHLGSSTLHAMVR